MAVTALTVLFSAFAQPPTARYVAYIGTGGPDADGPHTGASDNSTVFILKTTGQQGELQLDGKQTIDGVPKWVTMTASGHLIVTANTATEARLQSFSTGDDGSLQKVSEPVSAKGVNCVHLCEVQNHIAAVSYTSGTVSVLPYDSATGMIKEATFTVNHTGHGPDPRQASPHPHMIYPSTADPNVLYSPDLGLDQVFQYRLSTNGSLSQIAAPAKASPGGSGPRHFQQSQLNKKLYVLNELKSTIGVYSVSGDDITTEIDVLSTLSDYTGYNKAAELIILNDEYLYVSNRGNNSIATFKMDDGGDLHYLCSTPSGGWTRSMSLTPDKQTLFALNQNENTVTSFRVDPTNGALHRTSFTANVPSPVTIAWKVLKE